jgi:hypothetical protein
VTLNPTDALTEGDAVALVGHGAGLPAKIAAGAHVVAARAGVRDYFSADVDGFEGGSGSGVFDAQGALVGIAARGGTDFELAPEGCSRSRVGGPEQGEQITYLSRAIEGLCEDPNASAPCPGRRTRASGCSSAAPRAGDQSAKAVWLVWLAWVFVRRFTR